MAYTTAHIYRVVAVTEDERDSEFLHGLKSYLGMSFPNSCTIDATLDQYKNIQGSDPGHTDQAMVHIITSDKAPHIVYPLVVLLRLGIIHPSDSP